MTERQDLSGAGEPAERRRGRVVVGVDGSAGSRAALLYAWTAAAARGAELEVVGAYAVSAYWIDVYVYDPSVVDSLRAHTEETVSRLVREVREDPAVSAAGAAGLAVTTSVTAGPAARELVRRSEEADLLVVGSRGRGGVRSAMLGSVALHCATHAACPVVVAHPVTAAPSVPPRVVVGIDGSARSRAALIEAAAEATRRDGQLEAVAAYQPADHWADLSSTLLPTAEQIRATVAERARAFVADTLGGAGTQPVVHVEVVEGPAHDVLVSRAHGAALLVIGSTGRGELRSLLLGSVALHCAMHATCPVMVVHPPVERPVEEVERLERAGAG